MSKLKKQHTPLGVIEGFYGHFYTAAKRRLLLKFLQEFSFDFYLYAPKNQPQLRRHWQEPLNTDFINSLVQTSQDTKACGLEFGFGISPLDLSENYTSYNRRLFIHKTCTLARLTQASIVAVLFDDMQVVDNKIGYYQNQIISDLAQYIPSNVTKIWFCPTFYSFDPILEKLFNQRPENYFTQLTAQLPNHIGMFWTGDKVVSQGYTKHGLEAIQDLAGDRLILWDNYPVNDGKRLCEHLFTLPFRQRYGLQTSIKAHACNTMNEALLSTLSLCTLPLVYQNQSDEALIRAMHQQGQRLFGKNYAQLSELLIALNTKKRTQLSQFEASLKQLTTKSTYPALQELRDFFAGYYQFDPQCLTD